MLWLREGIIGFGLSNVKVWKMPNPKKDCSAFAKKNQQNAEYYYQQGEMGNESTRDFTRNTKLAVPCGPIFGIWGGNQLKGRGVETAIRHLRSKVPEKPSRPPTNKDFLTKGGCKSESMFYTLINLSGLTDSVQLAKTKREVL